MRVVYCNPIALDYRIPFYQELVELFNGGFYFLYSEQRYRLTKHERVLVCLKEIMGRNAVAYTRERVFNTYTRSFRIYDNERGQRIPFSFGLTDSICALQPDILITEGFFQWTPWVLLYGWRKNIPVMVSYERTMHTERNTGRLKTAYRKWVDKYVAGYLVNGRETEAYLRSIGVSATKIHKVGMSADSKGLRTAIASLTEQEKTAFRNRYAKGEGGLVFLFTGKLIERKGAIPLLEVWKEHILSFPNDSLVMVGDGELYEDCKALAGNESSVFLEGRVEYETIYRYYAMADVYVLPTIEDNWSLVVPEAMACGLPVATSVYNGCHSELVREGENGIVFDTFQPNSMLRALAYFHQVDLKAFGRRSIELEKAFSTEACAKRAYEAITQSVSLK